jgi:PncC family amidohydrolase
LFAGEVYQTSRKCTPEKLMSELVTKISPLLIYKNWRLAVAESATGGLLGHMITQVPGSSAFFWGGVIAYANEIKTGILKVQETSIINWGAVSTYVALEMAQGVCQVAHTEVGISITGIAGPGGATPIKPVGLYYIGLALPHDVRCWCYLFNGTRAENNQMAAKTALEHLLVMLQ